MFQTCVLLFWHTITFSYIHTLSELLSEPDGGYTQLQVACFSVVAKNAPGSLPATGLPTPLMFVFFSC